MECKVADTHTGIVLKRLKTSNHRIALIDKKLGRIEGVILHQDLCAGMLMHYHLQSRTHCYFINHVQLLHLPLSLAQVDLLFLHHVLELCYYFAPVGSCVAGVFDLLAFLYTVNYLWSYTLFKKVFLFKLLTTIGVWPDYYVKHTRRIQQLHILPIDRINTEDIDLACEKELDQWLWCCVAQHPYIDEFKTVHFLSKNRVV